MVLPDPERERREQRIRLDLAAWATDIAATLNAKYGSLVDLRVGAMTFPARQLFVGERWHQLRGAAAEPAGPEPPAGGAVLDRTSPEPSCAGLDRDSLGGSQPGVRGPGGTVRAGHRTLCAEPCVATKNALNRRRQ